MTLELWHGIRDYTLTRTSIPNHAGNINGSETTPRPFSTYIFLAVEPIVLILSSKFTC